MILHLVRIIHGFTGQRFKFRSKTVRFDDRIEPIDMVKEHLPASFRNICSHHDSVELLLHGQGHDVTVHNAVADCAMLATGATAHTSNAHMAVAIL